ncbi:diguanylate cyclase (GGDEF)-like protein [Rhodoferax ferrireducens]|uniref:diguanylate cyclase n=1 Tax=Rhodoferax ferrireducens TaxID=192843 RepID=A0ABU2C7V7_9BURK|nr:GGDEF domain-containing protein [Rhodoferax ferrireducens]MDR7377422.1 diguanylate cyclase (GGDEF)-like protein [Rhodoferax ferrireducens]
MKTSTPYHRSSWTYLSNEPASRREIWAAWATVLVSTVIFALAASYARTPLTQFPVFIPIYVTSLVICDLVTAVLLFGQFRALGSVALLVLGGGYFFTAIVTAAYALIFPGMFAPTGLLGSGPQTSSAMYMLWHTGIPLAVMAYARSKAQRPDILMLQMLKLQKARFGIKSTVFLVLLAVAAFTLFATSGHELLPTFLDGNRTTVIGKVFLVGIWMLSFVALGMLWRSKPHTVLDVWLHVVMCVWLFDLALAAVLNTGRYDLGWYVGRIYGLLAAGFLLIVLLSENARHYARLVKVSAELRTANDTLWQISMKDGLTELANRRSFDTHLAEHMAVAVRYSRPLALVLVDVDHFKNYNDAYGHLAGDDCLKLIASALDSCCQRPTDMAARYGGEEFALVLPDTDRVGAAHIAQAVQAAVANLKLPHRKSSTGPHVSISSGVAVMSPGVGMTAEMLIGSADKALYQAKDSGRNQVALIEATPA